ncbi:radical SAM protein [Helicobacter fennelliae]|uniref:Radical SAM protein n=1 Tax=Helicobacter fennelliae TaxID=215 RepID=A0A2X3DLM6_9HELI|nr:radical SAM protein [Helicobacter fennelliae]SQB99110.1 radical SAM protein [Helicobacter fennelliae]
MPRSNIVFGPVRSRRFGRSLGVDLSPNKKQCNFDCVYCELQKAKPVDMMNDVIPKEMVIEAIRDAAMSIDSDEIDVLTFSANGEPTLYPYLYEVISAVKGFLPPHIKTLILSNGSKFHEQQKALLLFDIVKFSIDGAREQDYKKTDRPSKNLHLENIFEGIREFASKYQGELVAEVLLVAGFNDNEENLAKIASFLREIQVSRIDIGSIDRPSAYQVKSVSYERLESFARIFEGLHVNIPTRSTNPQTPKESKESSQSSTAKPLKPKTYTADELYKLIATRPIALNEATFLLSQESLQSLQSLIECGKIIIQKSVGIEFYVASKAHIKPKST